MATGAGERGLATRRAGFLCYLRRRTPNRGCPVQCLIRFRRQAVECTSKWQWRRPGQTNPGGWGATDFISNVDYVRNSLAVTPAFKPDIATVQVFYIPAGVQLQVGTVGPQTYDGIVYPGRGNQVQILNYGDRSRLVPIGPPRKIN